MLPWQDSLNVAWSAMKRVTEAVLMIDILIRVYRPITTRALTLSSAATNHLSHLHRWTIDRRPARIDD